MIRPFCIDTFHSTIRVFGLQGSLGGEILQVPGTFAVNWAMPLRILGWRSTRPAISPESACPW